MDRSKTDKARIYGPYLRERKTKGSCSVREYQVIAVGATGKRTVETFRSEGEANEYAAELRRQACDEATFEGALISYEAHQRGRGNKPRGIQRAVERIRAFLGPECDLWKLTPPRFQACYDRRKATVAVDSHRNELSATKTFLRWADSRGLLRRGVLDGCCKVAGEGKRRRGKPQLRVDELRLWMDVAIGEARGYGSRAERATVSLCALLLGMRAGEILGMEARDIDDGGRLAWTGADCKSERSSNNAIEIPDVLQPILLARKAGRAPTEKLFPGHVNAYPLRSVHQICDRAGVPRVSAHAMRGTLAKLARSGGMAGHMVAATLGHASHGVTDRHYAGPAAVRSGDARAGLRVLQGGNRAKKPASDFSHDAESADLASEK